MCSACALSTRRPLVGREAQLSELARKELDIVAAAARAVAVFGPQAVPNYIISMCQSVSDLLEAGVLLKEAGLLDAAGPEPYSPVGIVPLFETIDDLQRGSAILEAALAIPLYRSIVTALESVVAVTVVPALPARSRYAIEKVASPSASPAAIVRVALQWSLTSS